MEKITSSEETENLQSKSVNQVSQNDQEQSINSSDSFIDNSPENLEAIKLQKSADNSEETVELQKLQDNATAYDNVQRSPQQDIVSSEEQEFPPSSLQDFVNDNPEHDSEKISNVAIQATLEYQKWAAEFANYVLIDRYQEEEVLLACRLAIKEMRKDKVCRDVSPQGQNYLQQARNQTPPVNETLGFERELNTNTTVFDNSQTSQQQDILSTEKKKFSTSSFLDFVNDNPEHDPKNISDAAIQTTSEYQKWKSEFSNSELENSYTEKDLLSAARLAITEMRKNKISEDVSMKGEIYLLKATLKVIPIDSKAKHSLTKEEKKYGRANKTTDKVLDAQCALFKKEIKEATSKEKIAELINTHGLAIWKHATTKVQASNKTRQDDDNWNDQAIYKARLKMRIILKKSSNPFLKKIKKEELDKYIEVLEEASRGMTTAEFDEKSEKKILLTGFDPYQGLKTNPSGVTALNFDGKMVGNAEIQTAIFPVRYEDFDKGLVEKFFGSKMDDIDAIITVSQTDVSHNIDVDRFSANIRGGGEDNNKVSKTGEILKDEDDFHESSLPYKEILEGEPENKDQRFFFNQAWATDKDDSNKKKYPGNQANKGTPWNSDKKINSLKKVNESGKPTQGSGGSYLSNEIHYRVSKMRTSSEATQNMPQGHLHINDVADKEKFMKDMKELIARIVKTLNKKKPPIGN
jgi:pyrrolidone-carboxylate peptidase